MKKVEKTVNKIMEYELMQIPYIINYGNRKESYKSTSTAKVIVKRQEYFINKFSRYISA